MSEKIFLLGVGCQKGGTTWLHGQLSKHPNVELGFTKEYHVFDALHVDDMRYFANQKKNKLNRFKAKNPDKEPPLKLRRHLSFYKNTDNYFNYFDKLWQSSNSTQVVGDITPSYSALPAEVFREIKNKLDSKGFKVKVIFLMRDPLERCWSMARMGVRMADINTEAPEDEDDILRLEKIYKLHTCEIRTRYDSTIRNLESVFNAEDIYYNLYEKLFNTQTSTDIQSFLGIKNFSPDTQEKYNVSEKQELNLPPGLSEAIVNHYKPTYEFCRGRFAASSYWTGYKYL